MKQINPPNQTTLKKTANDELSLAEKRRYEDIVQIQSMLAEGYAPVQVKNILNTTYNRIRRYAAGDPAKLCRFGGGRVSEAEKYKNEIIELLMQNTPLKQALRQMYKLGYSGKRTAFEKYCHKLISELKIEYAPRRTAAGVVINPKFDKPKMHYVSKTNILKHLWSDKPLSTDDTEYIFRIYPNLSEIKDCIVDFRKIYETKDTELLKQFIARYATSQIAPIKSFANGLLTDITAVTNSVTSDLSNGFVEGNNNKIKAIKRTMYGRAKIDLLRVKVIHAR